MKKNTLYKSIVLCTLAVATFSIHAEDPKKEYPQWYKFFEPIMSDYAKLNWYNVFKNNGYDVTKPPTTPTIKKNYLGQIEQEHFDDSKQYSFKDVAGDIPEDIVDLIEQLKDSQRFVDFGLQVPKGILLYGPPGTGKTLFARAIAGEADAGFFHASGSEFIEMFVGVGAQRVRQLFSQADTYIKTHPGKKAIIFIDEIDSIGGSRSSYGMGNSEQQQTINELLNQMDGYKTNNDIIVIAATNVVDMLDTALTRPGRFDIHIEIPLASYKTRVAVLNHYVQKIPTDKVGVINIDAIARATEGFSNADLKMVVDYAAKLAVRTKSVQVTQKHFEQAAQKIKEQQNK